MELIWAEWWNGHRASTQIEWFTDFSPCGLARTARWRQTRFGAKQEQSTPSDLHALRANLTDVEIFSEGFLKLDHFMPCQQKPTSLFFLFFQMIKYKRDTALRITSVVNPVRFLRNTVTVNLESSDVET